MAGQDSEVSASWDTARNYVIGVKLATGEEVTDLEIRGPSTQSEAGRNLRRLMAGIDGLPSVTHHTLVTVHGPVLIPSGSVLYSFARPML